jgi:mannose-6-phosphate isomerase-like protein (cupin superfamily)
MKNKTTKHLMKGALALLLMTWAQITQAQSTDELLKEFIESYQTDPMAISATFGIKVGNDWWTVSATRKEEPFKVGKTKQYTFHNYGPHEVTIRKGQPSQPTWYFRLDDRSVLDNIYNKVWTASTAAAKSMPSDKVAFDIEDMDAYVSTQGATATAYLIMEHFWKKDTVEITEFSRDSSLPSHGAMIVSLYTMKDKRIGWFSLGKDEIANGERNLDKGQVPNLFIITKGKGKAILGESEVDLVPGMSIFVPPYVKHVIYNTSDEPLEGVLVLFGDNIDYAKGQSYMEFLEKEYAFYETNESVTTNKTQ